MVMVSFWIESAPNISGRQEKNSCCAFILKIKKYIYILQRIHSSHAAAKSSGVMARIRKHGYKTNLAIINKCVVWQQASTGSLFKQKWRYDDISKCHEHRT